MNDVEDELEGKKRKEEKLRKKDHEAAAMDKVVYIFIFRGKQGEWEKIKILLKKDKHTPYC